MYRVLRSSPSEKSMPNKGALPRKFQHDTCPHTKKKVFKNKEFVFYKYDGIPLTQMYFL
jgi:hypothetical protein